MIKELIVNAFNIFQFVLLVWIVMSWIPDLRGNKLFAILDGFFDTLLSPIRRVIPPIGGTLDISPIILVIALQLLVNLLLKIL
jgi:YggT family protein